MRLVGIGFDKTGADAFYRGGFWKGELFINKDRTIYKALNFKKNNLWNGFGFLADGFSDINSAADKAGVTGDFVGDGLQLGGTYIFEKGTGRVLMAHNMKSYADHAKADQVFDALGIEDRQPDPLDEYDEKHAGPANDTDCDSPDCGFECVDCDIIKEPNSNDSNASPDSNDADAHVREDWSEEPCSLPQRTYSKKQTYDQPLAQRSHRQ